jgi:polyphosphate kinase
VLAPVEDSRAYEELSTVLDVLLADNTAWQLESDGSWQRPPREAGRDRSTHQMLMRRARLRARRAGATRS